MSWKMGFIAVLLWAVVFVSAMSCGNNSSNNNSNNNPNLPTVIFDTDGGNEIDPVSKEANLSIYLPLPVKTGFIFDGWYDGTALVGFDEETYVITKNITLKAKWTQSGKGPFKVTFVLDNGSGVNDYDNFTGFITVEPVPSKAGFIFGGWFDNAGTAGFMAPFPYLVSQNTTFYARWIAEPGFTVTYVTSPGSAIPPDVGVARITVKPYSYSFGNVLVDWLDSTTQVNFPYAVRDNVTLYALWEEEEKACKLAPRWRILLGYFLNG